MSASPGALESAEQLRVAWRAIVLDRGGEVLDEPGLAMRWADSTFGFWNAVTLTENGADSALLDDRLSRAVAYMRGKSQPGLVWLFEDLLDDGARAALPQAVERAGLRLALSGFGMAGDILPLAEPSHPELAFVRVSDEATLEAYADVNARAYRMPREDVRSGLRGSRLWTTGMHAYLGLRDGRAVTAAATIAADDRLFVALVATVPEAQRRGFGEAVTRKALHAGGNATGLRSATLHATLAGAPVYERIGFEKVATIGFYGLAP